MKYLDTENKRIIYIKSASTKEFWTDHWLFDGNLKKRIKSGDKNGLVKNITEKFLKKGSRIIKAGCGISQNVYGLTEWGYEAFGIDYTEDVIKKTKELFPDLNISVQDVRKLNFPNDYFDGYWSLGVIEHFVDGYDPIIKEAKRVLKDGGYMFLTTPWMSPLRKMKAKMRLYPIFKKEINTSNFYEFILDDKQIINNIEANGFKLILRRPYDAIKGFKDEISGLGVILQKIYDSKNMFVKAFRFCISIIFAPFAGHIILLVFRK